MKRGRPANRTQADHARQDRVIASTVHQLLCWGYPRKVVFDVVAECTDDLFGAKRNAIKAAGVKRIYDDWVKRQRNPWFQKYGEVGNQKLGEVDELSSPSTPFVFRPSEYTRQSLARRLRPRWAPRVASADLARQLIDNSGTWPEWWRDLNAHFDELERTDANELPLRTPRSYVAKRSRGRPRKIGKRGT